MKKGDYHSNMNGDNFMEWVTRRLVPTFEALYPGKKMVLVLDNAPYHHVRDQHYIDPQQLKRIELINTLINIAGRQTITAKRAGVEKTFSLEAAKERGKGGADSPYVKELQSELRAFLQTRPDLQRSKLKSFFEERGWTLIFTPPYCPALQPIEMVWSFAKRKVASRYKIHRSLKQTREHLMDSFYGRVPGDSDAISDSEGDGLEKCDPALVQRYIRKAHKFANNLIVEDEQIDGTVDGLIVKDEQMTATAFSEEEEDIVDDPAECLDQSDVFFSGTNPLDDEELLESCSDSDDPDYCPHD